VTIPGIAMNSGAFAEHLGALTVGLGGCRLRRKSRARTVALFEANSNFAWSARVNGGVASSGAGARGAHADR
jgi:hypothetical protein